MSALNGYLIWYTLFNVLLRREAGHLHKLQLKTLIGMLRYRELPALTDDVSAMFLLEF